MRLRIDNNFHRGNTSAGQPQFGFTVLELLVVFSIIGVMLALLLPAVLYAREAARRTTCVSQMRQLGVGLQHFHSTRQRLPAAWSATTSDPNFVYGWGTALLDSLEQAPVGRRLDAHLRPTPEVLTTMQGVDLAVLKCPSDITEPTFELLVNPDEEATSLAKRDSQAVGRDTSAVAKVLSLPTANYVGVFGTAEADDFEEFGTTLPRTSADGAVVHDRIVRWKHLQRGLSNTLLVGERTMATVPSTWFGVDLRGEDAPCRLVGSAITHPNCELCDECEFSSRHSGGANFLWADGHVDAISDSIKSQVYQVLAQRAGSE